MTLTRRGRRPVPARPRTGLVALLLAAGLVGPWVGVGPRVSAASAAGVSWSQYRSAAVGWSASHVLLPGSALRSQLVRWPDGTFLRVSPSGLVAGLASPELRAMTERALTLVVQSPVAPPPPSWSLASARASYAAILRQPAFASARVGVGASVARVWRAFLGAVGAWWIAVLRWLGRTVHISGGRPLLLALGALAAAAVVARVVLWLREGLERRGQPWTPGRGGRLRPPVEAATAQAEARLAAGDARGALRLVYRAALAAVADRTGVPIRPGWTALQVRCAADLDVRWPAFAELGALHQRLLFAPRDAAPVTPDLVTRWLGEVRGWSGGSASRAGRMPA